jgi:hypothetical protein
VKSEKLKTAIHYSLFTIHYLWLSLSLQKIAPDSFRLIRDGANLCAKGDTEDRDGGKVVEVEGDRIKFR